MARPSLRVLCALGAVTIAVAGSYVLVRVNLPPAPRKPGVATLSADPMLISRGEYLARLGDCAGCHTARESAPFAGGQGIESPFGTIYSTNITPDPKTGIGGYSYADFERALREGVAPGGKHLYPAMPYTSYAKITDKDMRALYAYFMHGVPAISHQGPRTSLPFPFNQRWGLALWNVAFAPGQRFQPKDERTEQWNRGAYIVQSLGHCGACHTPRGIAFEERGYDGASPWYLTGGLNGNWFAPKLRGDPGSGLGRLSEEDIVSFLRSGHGRALHGVAFGAMSEVVEDSTQYFKEEDLRAVARYLKSLPAQHASDTYQPRPAPARQAGEASISGHVGRPGAGLYMSLCAECHQAEGQGEPMKFPALAGNPAVLSADTTSLIRLLLEGGRSPRSQAGPRPRKMPMFGDQLTDIEIARVLSFIRTTWGNHASAISRREVSRLRHALAK